ncbi:hypothetical protein H8959_020553 [Pygathrix nigripes]
MGRSGHYLGYVVEIEFTGLADELDNLFQSMYYPLQLKFLETVHTLCGRIPQVFLKQIEKTMKRAYEKHVIIHVGPNQIH